MAKLEFKLAPAGFVVRCASDCGIRSGKRSGIMYDKAVSIQSCQQAEFIFLFRMRGPFYCRSIFSTYKYNVDQYFYLMKLQHIDFPILLQT